MLRQLFLVLALTASPVVAQVQASVASYGSACPGTYPTMTVQGLPQLGTTFYVTGYVPACSTSSFCSHFLVAGFAQTNTPFNHPTLGNGCAILVRHDLLLPVMVTGTPIAIPNQPTLAGFQFYLQGVELLTSCGWFGCTSSSVSFTDGLCCTVGI